MKKIKNFKSLFQKAKKANTKVVQDYNYRLRSYFETQIVDVYKKELIYGILNKKEKMVKWMGSKDGYNEQQKETLLDLDKFYKTLKTAKNPNDTSYAIPFVSCTQMSIARNYGEMDIEGKEYKYIYTLDALIEKSILDKYRKFKKAESKEKLKPDENEFLI